MAVARGEIRLKEAVGALFALGLGLALSVSAAAGILAAPIQGPGGGSTTLAVADSLGDAAVASGSATISGPGAAPAQPEVAPSDLSTTETQAVVLDARPSAGVLEDVDLVPRLDDVDVTRAYPTPDEALRLVAETRRRHARQVARETAGTGNAPANRPQPLMVTATATEPMVFYSQTWEAGSASEDERYWLKCIAGPTGALSDADEATPLTWKRGMRDPTPVFTALSESDQHASTAPGKAIPCLTGVAPAHDQNDGIAAADAVKATRAFTETNVSVVHTGLTRALGDARFALAPALAAPEPAAWAEMQLGLLLVGGVLRRRQRGLTGQAWSSGPWPAPRPGARRMASPV